MNSFVKTLATAWRTDRLRTGLWLCWLATVVSSFIGPYGFPITIPVAGTLYLFRLLLPVTALLYLVWAVRGNDHFWRDSSALEKWIDVLIGIMLVYGAISLLWAISFMDSFRTLFNLCFDLCFFFLMLRLCRDEKLRRLTLNVCYVMLAIVCILGVYEIFFGGLVSTRYDSERYQDFTFFLSNYQYPVVFFGNTNDFSLLLVSLYAVFLPDKLSGKTLSRGGRTSLVGLGAVIYFLLLATSSRFCQLAFALLVVGFALWAFCTRRERRTLVALLLCFVCLWFTNQYRYIVPPIQQYFAEREETKVTDIQEELPLVLGDPNKQSLTEQFVEVDEETGETTLRTDGSAGIRAHLLLHALDCFLDSRGLGVGLGNTGAIASQKQIFASESTTLSIHCFIARIIADYGIFVLIPLCAIGWLLLAKTWWLFRQGMQRRDRCQMGFALLFLMVLCTYPFTSTASSDAQDNIPMWIYLASVVLFAQRFSVQDPLAEAGEPTANIEQGAVS